MVILMAEKILYIMAVVVAAFLVSGWLKPAEYLTEKRIHIVTAGQTVWEIATVYLPKQDKKMTVGEFVHTIYKANNIDPRLYLQPGDKLIIPMFKEVKNND